MIHDLRLTMRALVKSPGFALAALAMLALGIGVNGTVFTVANGVLFKGFPGIEHNNRMVYIAPKGYNCCLSYPAFLDLRAQAKSFDAMAMVHGLGRVVNDEHGYAARIDITEVSAGTFALTGYVPILGRDFTAGDQADGAAPVAILNYGFWQRRYAKNPAIIGQRVRLNGVPTTIIGVMPRGYTFPQTVDMWTPLVETPYVLNRAHNDTWMGIGRMRQGVTFEQASAEVDGLGKRLGQEYPLTDKDHPPQALRFDEFFIGPTAAALYGCMWGAVGFVLLIACANLANLLLARAMGRSREISVRIALGAGRWRIVRQLLTESLILSTLGGFFGWWIAKWGVTAYAASMAQKSSWLVLDYSMDTRVLLYLIAISIATGILFGLAPAARLAKLDVNVALKDGARGATTGGRAHHLSSILVTGEMALAIVLLAGAGVMIRSFLKIHDADLGVNLNNVLAGSIELPVAKYPLPEQRIAFFDRLTERLEATAGVESVAMAESPPTTGATRYTYELADAPTPAGNGNRPFVRGLKISPGYFRTMRARLVAGREFNDGDSASAPPVAIVNQMLATQYWPGEDPVGKRLRLFNGQTPGPWITVAGVASNIIQNDQSRQRFDPMVYLPYRQSPGGGMWLFVRTKVTPAELASAFRSEVRELDPDLPIFGAASLVSILEGWQDSRFYGALFLIFAAIALLLASIGLYTVVANSVSQRTQELGIRMAIGASSRDILRLVLQQGMLPLGLGLAIGLAGSLAVNRVLKAVLVGVSPFDPVTLMTASGVLSCAAALGCLIPALRAVRVDPVIALRHE